MAAAAAAVNRCTHTSLPDGGQLRGAEIAVPPAKLTYTDGGFR